MLTLSRTAQQVLDRPSHDRHHWRNSTNPLSRHFVTSIRGLGRRPLSALYGLNRYSGKRSRTPLLSWRSSCGERLNVCCFCRDEMLLKAKQVVSQPQCAYESLSPPK